MIAQAVKSPATFTVARLMSVTQSTPIMKAMPDGRTRIS